MEGAHRVAFFLTHGYWPAFACHTCDNVVCCNPAHIYDGSYASNTQDKVERFRTGRIKLSTEQFSEVMAMRSAGQTIQSIADHFDVHYDTISRAISGKTKTWVMVSP